MLNVTDDIININKNWELEMKIGLAVCEFKTCNTQYNIEKIRKTAEAAKQYNIDLLCFGEAVFQGFHSLNGDFERDLHIAVTCIDMQNIFSEVAIANSVALALWYIEKENDKIYSSYIILDKKGQLLCNYRRVSVGWKEPHWSSNYYEGNDFEVFTLCGKAFTIALCGDLWSEQSILSRLKSKTILWPVYIDSGYEDWTSGAAISEYAEQAKITGNDVFLVGSILRDENNAEGRAIYFRNGEVAEQLELGKEGILICEI